MGNPQPKPKGTLMYLNVNKLEDIKQFINGLLFKD
jgi:hypothetical protein